MIYIHQFIFSNNIPPANVYSYCISSIVAASRALLYCCPLSKNNICRLKSLTFLPFHRQASMSILTRLHIFNFLKEPVSPNSTDLLTLIIFECNIWNYLIEYIHYISESLIDLKFLPLTFFHWLNFKLSYPS